MNTSDVSIVSFPPVSNLAERRTIRKTLFAALRLPVRRVILDLSNRCGLNHDDIDLLLDCAARVSGRDLQLMVVAGTRSNRALLEVTRISSVLPVCTLMSEALADPIAHANPGSEPALRQTGVQNES